MSSGQHDALPDFQPVDVDLTGYDVPHPRPYCLGFAVVGDHLSNVVDHVSNVEYVRWFDRAAELHSDALGYTRRRLLSEQRMWFVARHEIDYRAEAHLGDELVMVTWVRDFRRVKSWRDYLLIRPDDQTVVSRASSLWVLVDLESRKPTRIGASMVRRFDPLLAPRPSPTPRDPAPESVTDRCTSP